MSKFAFGLVVLMLFCLSVSYAQDTTRFGVTDDARQMATMSLNECLEYALRQHETIRKAQLGVQTAEQDIKDRLSTGLPQINAGANLTYNYLVQKSVLDGNSAAADIFLANVPRDQRPATLTFAFVPNYTSNFSINLSQQIFDFSYLLGVRAARAYADLARQQVTQSKVDVVANVMKAYYAVLINEERLALIDANYRRVDSLYKNTKALFANGIAERVDVLRTEVLLNNLRTEREKLLQLQILAHKLLKFQMGMPVNDSLTLSGNMRELALVSQAELNEPANYQGRIEYSILKSTRFLQEVNLKYSRSLYYPRLTASASYGANTGSNQFGNIWEFSRRWFTFGAIGLNLNIPIYDGGRRRAGVNKVKIELEKLDQDISLFQRTAELQTEQARSNLITYAKDLEVQRRNMELAQEVARVARSKYENGIGSTLDITTAEASFREAETNYYVALYNVVLSKVDLDKAQGKLNVK